MGLTTSKVAYRAGFGPFPPGGVITSFPYCARCLARPSAPERADGRECCGGPLMDLEQLLHQARIVCYSVSCVDRVHVLV